MAAFSMTVRKRLTAGDTAFELDFCIDAGGMDCVALFGHSGAGKTTLLRMIAGLTVPDEGRIALGDRVLFDSAARINVPPQHRRVGLVFQEYALFPRMTVEQNVRYGLARDAGGSVDSLLETFGLAPLRRRLPAMLSGGQQQRVALARTLAANPSVLLLDEPLSALDPVMRTSLQEALCSARRAMPVLTFLVSHDCGEIFRLATRVVRIADGSITASGTPQEVFAAPGDRMRVSGQVLDNRKHGAINVVTIAVGEEISRIALSPDEAEGLAVGDLVSVSVKAFNPDVRKIVK
ncbi:MAG TPA: ATP-binding cassette domain-containing protein [Chitinivibrionales bacterium]|nr:ATP-binding cassette domain-containing protein [Chitinivibrionales bacterium]